MRKIHKLFTAEILRSVGLGTLCALGAFAMGIETAGDVHPFTRSEAALEEIRGDEEMRGDMNGNGHIDADDAYLLYQVTKGTETPTAEDILLGDTNGDGTLTEQDLEHVLYLLSIR